MSALDSTQKPSSADRASSSSAEPESKAAKAATIPKSGTAKKGVKPTPKSKPIKTDQHAEESDKIRGLEEQIKELEDKYVRVRAEYENHIKRTNREKSELTTYAGTHVFRLILPILDDLRRIIDHAQEEDPVVQGVTLIIDKFTKILEAEGVQVFHSVEETFDPELHEALMTRSSEEHPAGIVLEEYEPGYKYKEKVLRHAKVIVSG